MYCHHQEPSTKRGVLSYHGCFKQGLHHTHLPWPRPLPTVNPGLSLDAMPVLTEFTTTLMFLKSRGFAASSVEGSGGGPETRVCRYLHWGPYTQNPSLNILHSCQTQEALSVA